MVTSQSKPLDSVPKNYISIGSDKKLHILWENWGNREKFLNIYVHKSTWRLPMYLPSVLVPEDAFYKFLAAMDEVIRKLPVKEPKYKEGDESPLVATQIVARSQHYRFELSTWYQKGYQWQFCIQTVQNVHTSEANQEQEVYLPFSAFPWLRQKMASMLAEHDGTQRIDKMPAIPEWAKRAAPDIEQQEQQVIEDKEKGDRAELAHDDIEQNDKSPTIPTWETLAYRTIAIIMNHDGRQNDVEC